jgi:putative acetyltransferase
VSNCRFEFSKPCDTDVLHDIWARSVQRTHSFLSKADVEALSPLARSYIDSTSLLIAVREPRLILGFMGMSENRIDSLFLDPDFLNQGVGRAFVDYAKSKSNDLLVEVNKQNEGAVAFYKRVGFVVIGRSDTDDEGRPFPLLYMAYKRGAP